MGASFLNNSIVLVIYLKLGMYKNLSYRAFNEQKYLKI